MKLTGGNGTDQFQLQVNQTSQEMADKTTLFNVYNTGQSDISQINSFTEWQEKTELTFWNSPEANKVQGTDATQFHPDISEDDKLIVFVENAFRF